MAMAYAIAEKTGRDHPFKEGHACRGWYEGFMARQATLSLHTPQALSYARAVSSNKETIDDFLAKFGALFGWLNEVIPPFMIYPRKRPVPEKLKEGTYANTVFHVSDNGWINKKLFFSGSSDDSTFTTS